MPRHRILMMLPGDQLGGAEQFLKMVASYYAGNGSDIYVYFGRKKEYNGWNDIGENPGINLHYSNSTNITGLLSSYIYLKKLKKFQFDIAWSSNIYCTGLLGFYRKTGLLKVKRLIGRESTSIFVRYRGIKLLGYKFFYNLGYRELDLLICQTDFMKEQLVRGIPRIAGKIAIKVFHNPIDLAQIDRKAQEGKPVLFKENRKYIVSAGRLIIAKGYDVLIKAFKPVSDEYPDIDLLILGDGELVNELTKLAVSLNLSERVQLPGRVDNVYPYFENAELCVVSSRVEGFPNVLLQMMSQNGNVISTTCAGGVKDIPGLLTCEPDDTGKMSELIDHILKSAAAKKGKRFNEFNSYLKQNSIESFINNVDEIITL